MFAPSSGGVSCWRVPFAVRVQQLTVRWRVSDQRLHLYNYLVSLNMTRMRGAVNIILIGVNSRGIQPRGLLRRFSRELQGFQSHPI